MTVSPSTQSSCSHWGAPRKGGDDGRQRGTTSPSMQCAAWLWERGPGRGAPRLPSRSPAEREVPTVGRPERSEQERRAVREPSGVGFRGSPGMPGSGVPGPARWPRLASASTAPEPPAPLRNDTPGCDADVEEEGRGGAWRGDVLPRWRRESEETVFPLGLLAIKSKSPF